MRDNEIITRLNAVINALDNVYVKGESNLNNLGGSITILREIKDAIVAEAFRKAENTAEE